MHFKIWLLFVVLGVSAQGHQHYVSHRNFFAPKYPRDFTHLSYANPLAPKGGDIDIAARKTSFDTLNPYILKGEAPEGIHLVHATLMAVPLDDPNVAYPYLAESIYICPKNTHVIFKLRKNATFHNGEGITSKDVVYTFELLKKHGLPQFSLPLAGVASATRIDRHTVKFVFKKPSTLLPFILAKMPVLSKDFYRSYAFHETTLVPPLGSGPYRIDTFKRGERITYRRIRKWWGRDLPLMRGHYNFDRVRYHYFKDKALVVEALARGLVDYNWEWKIARWKNDYDFPAIKQGKVIKGDVKKPYPHGLNALFLNTRKPHLKDRRVRKALNLLFNFEWLNHKVMLDHYARNKSIFMDTGFGAQGKPSEEEVALLSTYKSCSYPPEARLLPWEPPKNSPLGVLRIHFEEALKLFQSAGWHIKDGVMTHDQLGPFRLQFLFSAPNYEKQYREYFTTLKRFGIEVESQTADGARFMHRLHEFDYDVVLHFVPPFFVPGQEQVNMWSSKAARTKGSFNLSGVRSSVVDDLVQHINQASSLKQLKLYASVLDRVINWSYYIIPMWAPTNMHVAYSSKFAFVPAPQSLAAPHVWWSKSSIVFG